MRVQGKVTKLLKNYPFYKIAIKGYGNPTSDERDEREIDKYMIAAPARTTTYSDTPLGQSSGSRAPTLTGGWTEQDHKEYAELLYTIERIETALEALGKDERDVITLKWVHGLTYEQIGNRMGYSREWVKTRHRSALNKLALCFRFDKVPRL